MKKAVAASLISLSFYCSVPHAETVGVPVLQPAVLSTAAGLFVMGSLETGSSGVLMKSLYLLDTKTGQVWERGCIAWDADKKCAQMGLRTMGLSDGAGGKIFDNAKEAVAASEFSAPLRNASKK